MTITRERMGICIGLILIFITISGLTILAGKHDNSKEISDELDRCNGYKIQLHFKDRMIGLKESELEASRYLLDAAETPSSIIDETENYKRTKAELAQLEAEKRVIQTKHEEAKAKYTRSLLDAGN